MTGEVPLALQRDDLSIANLISSGWFGDRAASVLVAGSAIELPGPEIVGTRSTFYPGTEDVMGWDITEKGFRIVLSPRVPDVIRENLGRDVDELLDIHDLQRSDIGAWIMHTAGRKFSRRRKKLSVSPRAHWKLPGTVCEKWGISRPLPSL